MIALAALALWATPDPLAEAEAAFAAGVASRARTDFRRAAAKFDRAWRAGTETPALCLAHARAASLAGDPAAAVVAYRRGLHLSPHDAALWRGLAYTRAGLDRPAPPRWQLWLVGDWGPVAVIIGLMLAGTLLAWQVRRPHPARLTAALVLSAVVLGSGLVGERVYDRLSAPPWEQLAVVRAPVILRAGNGPNYTPRRPTPLPPGTELTLLARRNDWAQVELPHGPIGWVPWTALSHPKGE